MSNGALLDIGSLPGRHPLLGEALVRLFGTPLVLRLSIDPTPLSVSTMSRGVTISRCARPGNRPATQEHREISWSHLPNHSRDLCIQWARTVNAQDVTEQAALGLMALLIHDLEGGVLQHVLPIGSGGDYFVLVKSSRKPIQVEVSGIREDLTGAESRSRLRQKSAQVLTHSQVGYASVTTFAHPPGTIVHSYLHFVRQRKKQKGGKKRKKP